MKQYSTFHFSGYSWNHHAGKISLKYALDNDIAFEEMIMLPEPVTDKQLKANEWEIERLLFALHIIGGISYYKTCLPKEIKVHSGELSQADAKFWNNVYEHGLGEFFFRNNIEFRGLIKFPQVNRAKVASYKVKSLSRLPPKPLSEQRLLVPIGGGKDSMVTIEMLRKTGAKLTLLRIGDHPIIDELAEKTGLPIIHAKRQLSPVLFKLNADGALNGHVPVTAYLSVLAMLFTHLYEFDGVVMSNERSANHGNVEFKGMEINHQWSKSIQFERAFRKYLEETVITDHEYFSLLRPFSELKIAEIFSRYPQYFGAATSCNKNWKIMANAGADMNPNEVSGSWCRECPKCTFVFAILAAFIPVKDLTAMFGKNLFEDAALIPLYKELLGVTNFKPFECVGTPDETKAAFLLAKRTKAYDKTPVMKMFTEEILPTIAHPDSLLEQCLRINKEHFIPAEFQPLIANC